VIAQTTVSSEYKLAQANLSDMLHVHRLERAAFPRDAYDLLTIALLLIRPGNVNLKAVTSGGRLVGHATGRPRLLSDVAWIVTLAVTPDHQRRGLGRALLAACEAQLNRPRVRLTVRASNAPAVALYKQAGYQQVRVWRRYYRGGENGLVMEKQTARPATPH
jgi:ribosomal-protein-alanine N-acetyltransferase